MRPPILVRKTYMRPQIPDSLDEELEVKGGLGSPLYRRAGYTSKSAFVAQAVKEKIEREKDKLD